MKKQLSPKSEINQIAEAGMNITRKINPSLLVYGLQLAITAMLFIIYNSNKN